MRVNKLRRTWAQGGAALNGWLAVPTGLSAETMAHQGCDTLTVDMQHGVIDYQRAAEMFTAISTADAVPMARAPGLDAVCVGPSDLSHALGCRPTFDDADKPVSEAIEMNVVKASEHGQVAGIHNGTSEAAPKRIDMGLQFVAASSDARLMASGPQAILSKMHDEMPFGAGETY